MKSWLIAFLCGILLLQTFAQLPNEKWIWYISVLAVLIYFLFRRYKAWLRLLLACAIGFTWCLWYAHMITAWELPHDLEGKTLSLTGYIASIPDSTVNGTSFLFSFRKIQFEKQTLSVRGLARLTWRNNYSTLHVGDKWHLYVRLKKPYGTLNPGGFDYEAWAFQEGIRANGYVMPKLQSYRLSSHKYRYMISRVREFFKEKIAANLPQTQTAPWITALAIGERHDIDLADWQVLRNTGTNHLMAIAGLHIGFMAALAHFIVAWVWRRFPTLCLRIPAMHVGAIAALIMAFIYSAMAGFSIPTQRASLMLFIFLMTVLLRRHVAAWHAWAIAMFCVLLLNPLSVLTESFFLSFGSVALIIYGVSGRLSPSGLWWKWGRIQWVIGLGLIPLSVALFHQCSLISFVANSIAIPWVGFIVVPLCLLGCFILLFSAKLGGLVLILADKILSVLWIILTWLAHLPGIVWYQNIPQVWMLIAAVIGVIFLLIPIGLPGRYLGIIGLLPIAMFKPSVPEQGEVWLNLLDVGQGLSAVVQTHQHILVFDAGARSGVSYDMGDSVVVPFLHFINVHKVDMLVISHGDNDHIGGAQAILTQFPVNVVKSSVPELLPHADYCLRGQTWNWDGVNFSFLHPTQESLGLNNNSSCVLRVTIGKKHFLLTGDIEKLAEKDLVEKIPDDLAADIIIAPHHGSKTSAVTSFVELVHPRYVLFPVGYRNKYHFPHQSVKEKYQEMKATAIETAFSGAVQFKLEPNGEIKNPLLYRLKNRHYWNN